MDPKIERNLNRIRGVRDVALAVAGIALITMVEGVIPGTSGHTVNALVYTALAGGVVAVGSESLLQHAEPY